MAASSGANMAKVRGALPARLDRTRGLSRPRSVKAAFDPAGRFNPGKLVSNGAPIMGITTTRFRAFNAPDGDALTRPAAMAVLQCLSLCGDDADKVPQFQGQRRPAAIAQGAGPTRCAGWHQARATGGTPDLEVRETDLLAVLDTCLGCKRLRLNLPGSGRDIPAMRSAFLNDYYQRHARPLADRLVLWAERFSPPTARA